MPREKWTMPAWMEDYLAFLPDGDRVEELMNSKATVQINAPLALMACETAGAVKTLTRIYNAGLLSDEADREEPTDA